jgi:hypothetical protein
MIVRVKPVSSPRKTTRFFNRFIRIIIGDSILLLYEIAGISINAHDYGNVPNRAIINPFLHDDPGPIKHNGKQQ